MANKISYGIKNVYFSVLSSGTYATPVALAGAVSLNLEAQGEITNFYADNTVYWKGTNNNGYEGDLELALIPDTFRTAVLGESTDDNGLLVESDSAATVVFALLFEFSGDANAKRHVLYNCVATRPAVASSTKEDSIEPQTQTITISATANANGYVKASAEPSATNYASWFSTVQIPSFT